MIQGLVANLICPFLGSVAFEILFNVPRRYYVAGGVTGTAGWLVYIWIEGCGGFSGGFYIQDADGEDEVSDHGFPDFRDFSISPGSQSLLYRILSGYRADRTGRAERAGGTEDRLCHCTWDRAGSLDPP